MQAIFNQNPSGYDERSSAEAYDDLCRVISQIDPRHKDCRFHIENVRAFVEFGSHIGAFHRLDLTLQLHALSKRMRDFQQTLVYQHAESCQSAAA